MEKLLIFLSSTTADLGTVRERVAEAVNRRTAWKALNQENFGAQPVPPGDYCNSLIAQADLFVGIIGHRWGSTVDGDRSFVEMECDVALEFDKPRLILMATDALRNRGSEGSWEEQRQRQFRDRLKDSGVTIEWFSSWEKLPDQVSAAVQEWQRERAAPSMIFTDLTLPPDPLYKPRFTNFSTFSGRETQRAALSRWLTSGKETVYGLIAGPAMGKSALAWMWIHQDVLGVAPANLTNRGNQAVEDAGVPAEQRPRGIIRWSFDEDARQLLDAPGSPFHVFLQDALLYASEGREGRDGQRPAWRLERLLRTLQRERFLLVLDGFEKELSGFQTGDAGSGAAARSTGGSSWRDCSDGLARSFLRELASIPMASRVLICSRARPRDLETDAGASLPFCRIEELGGLEPEETGRLLIAQDLPELSEPSSATELCRRLGGSPLGLQLASKALLYKRETGSSPDPSWLSPSSLTQEEEIQKAFAQSYDWLPPDRRRILCAVAAFRGPVERRVLERVLERMPSDQLDRHLRILVATPELLTVTQGRYDMHPLVRHFIRDRSSHLDELHVRAADYLALALDVELKDDYQEPGRTGGLPEHVPERSELNQYVELFHHLLGARRRAQAFVLFVENLWEPLSYFYSDVGLLQELLIQAFPRFESPERLLSKDTHQMEAFGLNQLANNFRMGGRMGPAVRLHQAVVNWDRLVERQDLQAIRQELLGLAWIDVGDYVAARENIEEALELCEQHEGHGALKDTSNRTACFRDLGRLHLHTGLFDQAFDALESGRALAEDESSSASKYLTPVLALQAWAQVRSGGDSQEALRRAKQALSANARLNDPVARHRAEAQAILGMAATAAGELGVAREAVEEALRDSRELNHRRIEMLAMIGAARLALAEDDVDVALDRSQLAARFAKDGRYVALEGEARLLAAEGHRRRGEVEQAVESARRARDLSHRRLDPLTEQLRETQRKPGFYDAPLYRQADGLLAELGAAG